MNFLLLIPFACGLAFPVVAWLLKRSMGEARDVWGPLWAANTAMLVAFVPPFLFAAGGFSLEAPGPWWQPLLCGLLFFLGQIAACLSFEKGDISLAVPIQGTKALMIAALASWLLGHPAGWNIWAAAALTPLALFFLREHAPGKSETRRHYLTVALGTTAAAAFAGFDVGIEAWAAEWGVWRFGFWAFTFQALLSQLFLAMPGKRFRFGGGTWLRLGAGSFGLALVTLGLTWVIAVSGEAAWTNILFNSRMLWSVLFVSLGARWLTGAEGTGSQGRRLLRGRLAGAALMMATLILAVL